MLSKSLVLEYKEICQTGMKYNKIQFQKEHQPTSMEDLKSSYLGLHFSEGSFIIQLV